jgi:hypothetical protein
VTLPRLASPRLAAYDPLPMDRVSIKDMGLYTDKNRHLAPVQHVQSRAAKYLEELDFKDSMNGKTKKYYSSSAKIDVDPQTRTVFANQGEAGYWKLAMQTYISKC